MNESSSVELANNHYLISQGPSHLTETQKRVSFGGTKETIVYETRAENKQTLKCVQECSESTSRVFVTSTDSAFPNRIAPPSSVTKMDPDRPSSASGAMHSPPLPLLQKIENEKDNPFRPEEPLYHVVDPIVEAYKTRPYPPSPDKAVAAPLLNSSPPKREKNGSPVKSTVLRSETDGVTDGAGILKTDEPHRTTLTSPKAGKVELVHMEANKKKCCKCCSIQ